MFKTIVSQVTYSTSLIRQFGDYARQLRRQQRLYAVAAVLTGVLLIIQLFITFSPIESANSSNRSDILNGVQSPDQAYESCQKNITGFQDVLAAADITCDDLRQLRYAVIHTHQFNQDHSWLVWDRTTKLGDDHKERRLAVGDQQLFIRPLDALQPARRGAITGPAYRAFVGKNAKGNDIGILAHSGNIITKKYPLRSVASSCSIINNECAVVTKTLRAVDASTTQPITADDLLRPSRKIEYTATITNNSDTALSLPITINLSDAAEYATIYDEGHGHFDPASGVLSWDTDTVPAHGTKTYTYVLSIAQHNGAISPMPQGKSDPTSYDCRITSHFGNTVSLNLDCPKRKMLESIIQQLPKTRAATNISVMTALWILSVLLYLRARLLNKELRIMRQSINSGSTEEVIL